MLQKYYKNKKGNRNQLMNTEGNDTIKKKEQSYRSHTCEL